MRVETLSPCRLSDGDFRSVGLLRALERSGYGGFKLNSLLSNLLFYIHINNL